MSSLAKLRRYYRHGGPLLVLQSLSFRLLGRDLVTPVLSAPYGLSVRLRGGVVSYKGVRFDATREPTDGIYRQFLTSYEFAESLLLDRHFSGDRDTIELGGGIGFVSCYTNAKLDADRDHVVVEANPDLIDVLEDTQRRNGVGFNVLHAAYTATGEDVAFNVHEEFLSSGVTERRDEGYADRTTVQGVSFADIVDEFEMDAPVLIADVEGQEHELIREELDVLADRCSMLFLELHEVSDADVPETLERLRAAGFTQIDREGDVRVFENSTLEEAGTGDGGTLSKRI